jgi:hypothetical protein
MLIMKINLQSIDPESFMVHQHFVGEHECFLVQPIHIGATWTKENLIFRSSLWDKEGNPVSLSFKKFFNWDEKPDIFPAPSDLTGAKLMEKLDGSTLIFSRYKGHTIIRTRGTVDARKQENGYEIDYLCEKYKKFLALLETVETSDESFVFEWISPTNRIVLNYGDEPDMALIAVLNHSDYSYKSQMMLDMLALTHGLRRPRTFSYNSVEEMKQAVEALRDQEGLCVYYGNEQQIRKVKAAQYLFLHRAKSEISSIEKIIDVYIDWFIPRHTLSHEPTGYQEFFKYLTEKFDFEIATMATGHASRICDAMKEVSKIMNALFEFASARMNIPRNIAAKEVLQAYGSTGRSSIIFKMMDRKTIGADEYKKLLYQVLK